ncbi:Csu type fimbrial protein [Candidatus Njordibacter sp. Uisw_002]|uniref:Csu type fimbrial protein n=1 Tax=Candidatus Njordibacter sp. Uisw_002 TaxID=3230971 RepID=UPI003D3EB9C1
MKTKFNQSTLKLVIMSAMALGSTALSVYTYAGTATSTLNVSVSVAHSCSIDSNPMAFGTYDGNASTALEAKATVVSTCTSGAAALITMSAGASAGSGSAEAPVRRMTAGAGKYLVYQVYSDVARGTVWGNTDPTGVALTGTGVSQTLTAYGSVPPAQLVAQGVYTDQLSITITY